jgi:hypothetical protein
METQARGNRRPRKSSRHKPPPSQQKPRRPACRLPARCPLAEEEDLTRVYTHTRAALTSYPLLSPTSPSPTRNVTHLATMFSALKSAVGTLKSENIPETVKTKSFHELKAVLPAGEGPRLCEYGPRESGADSKVHAQGQGRPHRQHGVQVVSGLQTHGKRCMLTHT